MIYTVGGIKGGSGKTTVAVNLAAFLAQQGAHVLLVDADEQRTASDFHNQRTQTLGGTPGLVLVQLAGTAVREKVDALRRRFDHIVIDAGGRDTKSQRAAVTVSDVFLCPFVPRPQDLWTLDKVAEMLDEMRPANPALRAFSFINRADPQGSNNAAALDLLRTCPALEVLDSRLVTRIAYAAAFADGLAVFEAKPTDQKAAGEFGGLVTAVAEALTNNNKKEAAA
jgi:chromosome partitioning protein